MWKFILLATILIVSSSAASTNFARNSGKFALQLYKTVLDDSSQNVVISPVSIQAALAFLYTGAAGSTARELSQGAYFEADENIVADNYKSLLDHHAQSGVVQIANKIYLANSFQVLPQFAEIGSTKFYSETESIDTSDGRRAAQIINSWVERKTNNKIQDLVTADAVQGSRSVIVNAVHFKADWVNRFENHATSLTPFWVSQRESKEIDMMYQKAYFHYAEFDDFQVIKLNYRNTDISFVVVLPSERDGLRRLEARFAETNADLNEVLKNLRRTKVRLQLPKFKIESSVSLEPVLAKMGMRTMFGNNADFSKLSSEGLKVGSVVHKAIIEVDEKGTEAAAATAIMMRPISADIDFTPVKDFVADHPFLYFLLDSNGHIFFMGRYVS